MLSFHPELALNRNISSASKTNAVARSSVPVRSGVPTAMSLKGYLGPLCLGKEDFEAIETVRWYASQAAPLGPEQRAFQPTFGEAPGCSLRASWFRSGPLP